MAGFPTRPSANAFGPVMRNRGRVRDPEKDVSAERMNLMRWQLAGVGQSASRAWLLAKFTGPTTIEVEAHGSAWQGAAPGIARTSAGLYVVTYAATYANELGDLVAPNLLAAVVSPKQSATRYFFDWSIASARIITVRFFDKSDVAADASFSLAVF